MDHPFEIHALRNGRWKIDSVMDDREFAVESAKALARRNGVDAVRIVRDMFNQDTGGFTSRTIFHTSRQQELIAARNERRKQALDDEARDRQVALRLARAGRPRVEALRRRKARLRLITWTGAGVTAALLLLIGWTYLTA